MARQERAGDELVTVDEAARRVKKDPATIRRWIREGRLPFVALSDRTRLVNWTALGDLTRLPTQEGGDE